MKKVLTVLAVLMFLSSVALAEEIITKIDDNRVKIQTVYYDKATDGKEMIINETALTRTQLDRAKETLETQLAELDKKTAKEYKISATAIIQTNLDRVNSLLIKLDE